MKAWWQRYRPTKRRLIQVYAALLHNAHLKGFIEGEIYTGPAKNLCVPGLNCYSCPAAAGSCPLGALQNALASTGARAPSYVLGILMLFGLILGRTICGWLCPMGLMQELLHKLPTPKVRKGRVTRALSYVKYGILLVFVIGIPLVYGLRQYPMPAFCKYICPAGTGEGAIGLLAHPDNADLFSMLGGLFTNKFVILVVLAAACVFVYRAFCRFLCPLGAVYGLFAKVSLLGVRVVPSDCTSCGRCVAHCPMDIRRVGDHECIACGLCVDVCPTGAIRWKGGRVTVRPDGTKNASRTAKCTGRGRRILAWAAALTVLAGALWFFNRPAPEKDVPVGMAVGERCADFTAPLYGPNGGTFDLSETRGRVTVINFWATWCTPCVAELPHFQRLHEEMGNDAAVIALHSDLVTEDVAAYLSGKPYTFPFGLDADGSVIRSLGGSTMLPMTVVLDGEGTIVYNAVGSLTYEELTALVQAAQ